MELSSFPVFYAMLSLAVSRFLTNRYESVIDPLIWLLERSIDPIIKFLIDDEWTIPLGLHIHAQIGIPCEKRYGHI